jgi:hypothetical protein
VTVHSDRLGSGAALGAGYHTVYTCPTGKRTIVKSIWLRNNTAAAITGAFQVVISGGATISFFQPLAATPAAGSTVKLEPWVVLRAGDALNIAGIAGSGVDAYVSGAELTL